MLKSILLSLSFVSASLAANFAAGLGRPGKSQIQVEFSAGVFNTAVNEIEASLYEGPNRTKTTGIPVSRIYGVNIGNWLVMEPWMSPNEWLSMGGEFCPNGDCSTCKQSEWSLSKALGRTKANQVFQKHWATWFTQADVNQIVALGLNTVRVPLPFWVIEGIVDTTTEPYAQGGLDALIKGLQMLSNAGLYVILDHHALPGVAASGQMFAGNCTSQVEFYNSPDDYNYKRAVTWSIVMAYLSHTHPAFKTVFSIQAMNEPIQDANQTPRLGEFEKAFVIAIRTLELSLGIVCSSDLPHILSDEIALDAFAAAIPIIASLSSKYNLGPHSGFNFGAGLFGSSNSINIGGLRGFTGAGGRHGNCLSTQFMNRDWQYNNPPNPADYAEGPQIYDNHLYFNFGGVAPSATEQSYMQTICNYTHTATEAAIGDVPLFTGEWSLATAFTASDNFNRIWGDAQKLAYNQGSGWIFWSWKLAPEAQTWPIPATYEQWSYKDAVAKGYFHTNPAQYFNPNVCSLYSNWTNVPAAGV